MGEKTKKGVCAGKKKTTRKVTKRGEEGRVQRGEVE